MDSVPLREENAGLVPHGTPALGPVPSPEGSGIGRDQGVHRVLGEVHEVGHQLLVPGGDWGCGLEDVARGVVTPRVGQGGIPPEARRASGRERDDGCENEAAQDGYCHGVSDGILPPDFSLGAV